MPLLEPADIGRHHAGACLDAAVAAIDLGVGAVGGDLRVVQEQGDIGVQRALVALEGEDVVAALRDDLFGGGPLAVEGIDGHDRALERQHLEQLGHGGDLV
jgi:hypothetical protein